VAILHISEAELARDLAATLDRVQSGAEIVIEQRDPWEVATVPSEPSGARFSIVPGATRCLNPAFDVTPAELVTALVTERARVLRATRSDFWSTRASSRLWPEEVS